jgi:FolB domain-containing protein
MSMAADICGERFMADRPQDRIHIRDLFLRCIVGINPDERIKQQDVIINIVLGVDLSVPCRSDRIEDTIDYKALKKRTVTLVEESSFYLIERLAAAIADLCLEDPRVLEAAVTVDKPGALRFAKSVAVEVVRRRGGG